MPKITYISDAGVTAQIEVRTGDSVMEGAIRNGVDGILAECGGSCVCATCHVYVDEKWVNLLPEPEDDELAMLESTAAARLPNSRLSCQLQVKPQLDGLIVRTPPTQK